MKQKLTQAEKREQRWAYIMIAPTIIGLLILNYYPLLDTIRLIAAIMDGMRED